MADEDSSSSSPSCRDDALALRLKLVAMASILVCSVAGVAIPLVCRRLRSDGGAFSLAKAFAAGVILSTGFVHMLPEAVESLSDPSLPEFPFSGFAAMMAALGTLVLDFVGTAFYERKHEKEEEKKKKKGMLAAAELPAADKDGKHIDRSMHIVGVHAHAAAHGGGGSDVEAGDADADYSHVRHIVVSQILELGIISHSVIIGLSLGVSQNPCTIRPLVVALSFHQFFEGFALGGCISQARFKTLKEILMACFFAITTPGGIAIGLAAASSFDPESPKAVIVEGILDSVSAGILIYMALVDLIATDFLGRQRTSSTSLQIGAYAALFLGAGSMSMLAVWA